VGDPGFIGVIAIVAVVGLATSFTFLRRVLEMRHERLMHAPSAPQTLEALASRLDRIENAVDATSLEVERIAEASRFMAKLLAERGAAAVPSPPATQYKSERVITPH
jgi:hypothetical protein